MYDAIRMHVIATTERVIDNMWDGGDHPKFALEERTRKVVEAIQPPLTGEERRQIAESVVARRIIKAALKNQPSHFDHILRALNTETVMVRLAL